MKIFNQGLLGIPEKFLHNRYASAMIDPFSGLPVDDIFTPIIAESMEQLIILLLFTSFFLYLIISIIKRITHGKGNYGNMGIPMPLR